MAARIMNLRRDDSCFSCASALSAGTRAHWEPATRAVTCLACIGAAQPNPPDRSPLDVGVPGSSARKEYERRAKKTEQRIEDTWGTGRLGRIAKFLSDDPQSTKAWAQGAAGEERVAEVLHDRLGDRAVLLHDRRVPGTRGNIDHLAIAASGVWVIDAKRWTGKVERRDVGSFFRTDLRLYVGGRDRSKAVTSMAWQQAAVDEALGGLDLPLHLALCLVDVEWPLVFAKPLTIGGVVASWPGKLADLILAEGPLTDEAIEHAARTLSSALPANR